MTAPSIRLASYNLQKCIGMDLRRRPARSLAVIDALDADVVILQEADKRIPPRPAALPHDLVAAKGWTILPFGQLDGSLGWHGNAMIARGLVQLTASAHIDLPGLEPRGAIMAELSTVIGPLRIIGLHLGLLRRYRQLQLSAVSRFLADRAACPTVIAGDFNEWGSLRPYEVLTPGFHYLTPGPSFPALRPVAGLDRFAHCTGLTAEQTGVYTDRPARIASDHLPIWADFRLPS